MRVMGDKIYNFIGALVVVIVMSFPILKKLFIITVIKLLGKPMLKDG